jgi:photosystem II stability/assembly factor-like uncharacterized protein
MKSKFSIFNSAVAVALLFSSSQLSAQGFNKLISGTTKNLLGVSAPSDQICYVTGAEGTILKTADGGGSWVKQASGLPSTNGVIPTLYSTWFTSTTTGYAVGDNGSALKTINGGSAWTKMTIASNTIHLRSIRFSSKTGMEKVGYATGGLPDGSTGYVFRTTDGGVIWNKILEIGGRGAFYSTFIITASTATSYLGLRLYCVMYDGSVYTSNDGGDQWFNSFAVGQSGSESYFVNTTTGFVGTSTGDIYKTASTGKYFEAITPKKTNDGLRGVDFSDGTTTGYFVGGNVAANTGTILKTTDGGTSWNLVTLPAGTPRLWGVDFTSSCNGYVTGLNGTILKYGTATNNTDPIEICQGNPTGITAVGSSTYSWATSTGQALSTGAFIKVNPSTTTTYVVTGMTNKCGSKISVKVTVLNCLKSLSETTTSIENNDLIVNNEGQVSPNPTSGRINIYPISGNELTSITIIDALGKTIYETKATDNNSPVEIDIENQPEGIYFVRLVNGSNTLNKKIIKQ